MGRGNYTKPQAGTLVDLTHSLARNIRGAWLMNGGGNSSVPNGTNLINEGVVTAPYKSSYVGVFLRTNSSSLAASSLPSRLLCNPFYGSFSATVKVALTSLTSQDTVISRYNGSVQPRWHLSYTPGLGGFGLVNWAGTNAHTVTPSLNTWYVLSLVYDVNVGTFSLYQNGVFQGSQSPGAGADSTSQNFVIGGISDNGLGSQINGFIDYCYVWNRALSSDEVKFLYARPFDLFLPPTIRRTYFLMGKPVVFRRALALDGARTGSRGAIG